MQTARDRSRAPARPAPRASGPGIARPIAAVVHEPAVFGERCLVDPAIEGVQHRRDARIVGITAVGWPARAAIRGELDTADVIAEAALARIRLAEPRPHAGQEVGGRAVAVPQDFAVQLRCDPFEAVARHCRSIHRATAGCRTMANRGCGLRVRVAGDLGGLRRIDFEHAYDGAPPAQSRKRAWGRCPKRLLFS